jgi:hypothetical protein
MAPSGNLKSRDRNAERECLVAFAFALEGDPGDFDSDPEAVTFDVGSRRPPGGGGWRLGPRRLAPGAAEAGAWGRGGWRLGVARLRPDGLTRLKSGAGHPGQWREEGG